MMAKNVGRRQDDVVTCRVVLEECCFSPLVDYSQCGYPVRLSLHVISPNLFLFWQWRASSDGDSIITMFCQISAGSESSRKFRLVQGFCVV